MEPARIAAHIASSIVPSPTNSIHSIMTLSFPMTEAFFCRRIPFRTTILCSPCRPWTADLGTMPITGMSRLLLGRRADSNPRDYFKRHQRWDSDTWMRARTPAEFTLNQFDVLNLEAAGAGDLTGSRIQVLDPGRSVGVYVGHEAATHGTAVPGRMLRRQNAHSLWHLGTRFCGGRQATQ